MMDRSQSTFNTACIVAHSLINALPRKVDPSTQVTGNPTYQELNDSELPSGYSSLKKRPQGNSGIYWILRFYATVQTSRAKAFSLCPGVEAAMEVARPTLVLDTQVFRDLFNTSPIGIAVENFNGQPLFVLTRIPAYMIFFPASCLNEVAISLRSVPSGSEFEVGDFVTTIAVPFPAYRLSLLEQYRLSRGERYGV